MTFVELLKSAIDLYKCCQETKKIHNIDCTGCTLKGPFCDIMGELLKEKDDGMLPPT